MKYRYKLQHDQGRPGGCSCSEDALRAYAYSIWCNYCPSSRYSDQPWWKLHLGVDMEERIGELDEDQERT